MWGALNQAYIITPNALPYVAVFTWQLTEDRCTEALEEIGRLVEDIPYRNQNVPAKEVQVKSLLPGKHGS